MNDRKKISRRKFLSAVASTAATTCIPPTGAMLLEADATDAAAQYSHVGVSREASAPAPLIVENPAYRLLIDPAKGTVASFRSSYGAGRELLIANHVKLPLFQIEFMDDRFAFKTVTSPEARQISASRKDTAEGQVIILEFTGIAGLPLDACVTIRCPASGPLTYWGLELDNRTSDWIGHVQFPVIEIPFDNPLDDDPGHILWSSSDGQLAGPVRPAMSMSTWGGSQRNTPEVWRSNNYPGQWISTQLMAYYNRLGGLYVACDDPAGLPKYLGPLMEDDGVTLGLGHFPGIRGPGKTKLPYHVVLGTLVAGLRG